MKHSLDKIIFIDAHQLSTFLLVCKFSTWLNVCSLKILSIPFLLPDVVEITFKPLSFGLPTKILPLLFLLSLNHFHSPSSLQTELCTPIVNPYHPSSISFVPTSTSNTRYFSSLHPKITSSFFSVKFIPFQLVFFRLLHNCIVNVF